MNAEFAARLVNIAIDKGATEAEVYMRRSKNLSVDVKEQKIDTIESSITMGYSLKIIRDGCLGFSYSTNPDEINTVAENAIEASRYSEPDDYLSLPTKLKQLFSVKIFDDNITSLSKRDAIDRVLLIESYALKEDKRIKKIRKASGSFSTNDTYIANSHNLNAHYCSTICAAQIMAIAEEGGESQIGWDYEGNRFLENISFKQVGRNAARRAAQLLGARKITPVKGLCLLDNFVASEFMSILSAALSAESVQKNRSMFVGKLGKLALNHKLDIIDNGLLNDKPGSKPVDDEGVPTTSKALIQKGVLNGFLHNTYTAKRDGVKSTGNAIRGGFAGIPSVGPTNLYLDFASKDHTTNVEGLIKIMNRGLYVTGAMGMHTANPISGEFSVGASGLWIENGEVKYPVKEAVISGNMLDLFRNIVMAGDDIRFYGNIGSPSLLIDRVDISG